MKLHFENVVTVLFFIISLLILAPACSNVAHVISSEAHPAGESQSVLINP